MADFLTDRITATLAQITAYEAAALALAGGVQSYTLDTGQDRQTVTKLDLGAINRTLESLYNRYTTLTARQTGCGVTNVSPSW